MRLEAQPDLLLHLVCINRVCRSASLVARQYPAAAGLLHAAAMLMHACIRQQMLVNKHAASPRASAGAWCATLRKLLYSLIASLRTTKPRNDVNIGREAWHTARSVCLSAPLMIVHELAKMTTGVNSRLPAQCPSLANSIRHVTIVHHYSTTDVHLHFACAQRHAHQT